MNEAEINELMAKSEWLRKARRAINGLGPMPSEQELFDEIIREKVIKPLVKKMLDEALATLPMCSAVYHATKKDGD